MLKRSAAIASVVLAAISTVATVPLNTQQTPTATQVTASSDLTVHEWGTFTTVAGENGQAVQWLPLGGPSDLPCFVDYFKNRLFKLQLEYGPVLDYQAARAGLRGTVRMETPVLYFYASRPTTVDVSVQFWQGLFTEWYPSAVVNQSPSYQNVLLLDRNSSAQIQWTNVLVRPGTRPMFPFENSPSHYYAARATEAAPIRVNKQDEKFLFYRGVAGFDSPISATLGDRGQVIVKNLSGAEIPRVVLFTKRGERIGYRIHGSLKDQAVLEPPSTDGTFPGLRRDLERTLVAEGLYPKEAQAMVETWRDSWFEDGTRVFYIVPQSTVDGILPLHVEPKPASVVRVFVGRMDVITPDDCRAVKTAFARGNHVELQRFGRLLGPIADRILANTSAPEERARMLGMLNQALKSYTGRVGNCE
jgi:hypothetical protein